MPLLPPKLLAFLDALRLRVPLRTAAFATIDLFRRLKIPFIRHTIRCVERKTRTRNPTGKRKIKVYFLCLDNAQWGMQSIYDAVSRLPQFEPAVLVSDDWIRHGSDSPTRETIRFFTERQMVVKTRINPSAPPDVLFTPYFESSKFGSGIDFHALYKSTLLCLVMYSWIVTDSDKHFFGNVELAYFWKIFLFNRRELEVCQRLSPVHAQNAVCLGFPRNDEMLSTSEQTAARQKRFAKRIIWAPHWSVLTHSRLGNFDRYAYPMMDWLKSHSDIEIVLKPHPLLKARLTDEKTIEMLKRNNPSFGTPETFTTKQEYEQFIANWKALPNGCVMDEGDYFNLFRSSDAMILDSGSFMAEYMILDKPMCFCNRDRTTDELKSIFNAFGKELLDGMTIASNWPHVSDFLEQICCGKDDKHESRSRLAKTYLLVNKHQVGTSIAEHLEKCLANTLRATP